MKMRVVCSVVLLLALGVGFLHSQSPAKPQPAAGQAKGALPAFDGNVANIVWGGNIESVTGKTPGPWQARSLINEKDTWFRSDQGSDPKDIVISFFKREPVLIGSINLVSLSGPAGVQDLEIWTSMAGPDTGFVQVASGKVPPGKGVYDRPETTVTFTPVEARFVKVRLVRNYNPDQTQRAYFSLDRIRVFEAQAPGYVPLLTRHPEIATPRFVAEGAAAVSAAKAAPLAGCTASAPPAMQPGTSESRKVLLVQSNYLSYAAVYVPYSVTWNRLPKNYTSTREEFSIFDRVETNVVATNQLQPWMLADYDTVVFEQACDARQFPPRFLQLLASWVAAGHKLIIHDSDKCGDPPDYSYLPYRFKTSRPGAWGKPGSTFRMLENTWMIHDLRGKPGFVDGDAWVTLVPPANELGDTNVITDWEPGWCGQFAVKNVLGDFGFAQAYAHHGKGLIIWEGLDVDSTGTLWLDIVRARQLAQGFNTDNLPCGVKVGSFVVVTEPRLARRGFLPGQTYTYPLSVIPNQKYKGTVKLAASAVSPAAGLDVRIEPASVTVAGEQQATLTVAVPAGAKPTAMALDVTGTDTAGVTSTLCLQLEPAKTGALTVVSALAPPTKTRKNLEIILDASGSMKAMLGKKSRWQTALDTLEDVLTKLPDDFNVGLRMYGHRELSTSPKTCTDTQLLVPVRKLDRAGIMRTASTFKPKGETPLVYSALQAPTDLKALGGGTVILITDGGESCKGDPVQAAADLKASGLDLRLNIVGFAVTDPAVQKVLTGFAQAGGGRFYAAQSGAALGDALLIAAIEKFPYAVFDMAGKKVAEGEAGWPAGELPPGDYKVVVKAGTKELVAPRVKIALGQTTTVKIVLKGDQLALE